MSTILNDVKKFIGGIAEDNTAFDSDILTYVNGAFTKMTRSGLGDEEGFDIDATTTWDDFGFSNKMKNAVKNFVTIDVKIAFDATTMPSFLLSSNQALRDEYLWTINNYADYWEKEE